VGLSKLTKGHDIEAVRKKHQKAVRSVVIQVTWSYPIPARGNFEATRGERAWLRWFSIQVGLPKLLGVKVLLIDGLSLAR